MLMTFNKKFITLLLFSYLYLHVTNPKLTKIKTTVIISISNILYKLFYARQGLRN